MIKIGFCIDSLEMGGAERLLVDIINALYETKEYDISLLTRLKSNSYFYNLVKNKINYFYLLEEEKKDNVFLKLKNSIKKTKNFKKFANNVDVIIDFLDGDFYKYIKAFKNKEKIIWLHLSYKKLQKNKKIDTKLIYYDKIVIITDAAKEEILSEKINIRNVYKIPNFIDHKVIEHELNEGFEIDLSPLKEYFLTVCRLNEEQKDVKTLIEAFSNYKGEEKLIIVGDGPDRENLEKFVKEKKLDKKIIFLGALTNPFILMKNAKIFILSSKVEGFGLVLVEALYCGTKVISSNCPVGPNEILKNGEIGELFEVGNSEDLLKKINKSLMTEYNKIQIIDSIKRYTKEKFVENFKELLR